jgi:hypothetical protein
VGATKPDHILKEKIRVLVERGFISWMKFHHNKDVCLLSSTIGLLKNKGVERTSMQQLADLTGFKYDTVWLKKKTFKVVHCTLDDFVSFLMLSEMTTS